MYETYIHTHRHETYKHMHTYEAYIHIHTCIHAGHMHIRIHIHTYTYAHPRTCIHTRTRKTHIRALPVFVHIITLSSEPAAIYTYVSSFMHSHTVKHTLYRSLSSIGRCDLAVCRTSGLTVSRKVRRSSGQRKPGIQQGVHCVFGGHDCDVQYAHNSSSVCVNCMDTYTLTHLHAYIHTMHACIRTFPPVRTHIYVHKYIAYMSAYIHMHTHTYIHACIHTYMWTGIWSFRCHQTAHSSSTWRWKGGMCM
jgi:hypothetical protein